MSDALKYLIDKYKVDLSKTPEVWIPCNRLVDLPLIFKDLGFTKGAEIGVLYGKFSEILCQSNPHMKVYSVDAWSHYPVNGNFRPAWVYEPIYQKAKETLSMYPNNEIIREWSQEAVKDFEDESLDFVFIDADHRFQQVTNDIAEWSKKVRKGGIISGHDFAEGARGSQFVHVKDVVRAWCRAYRIQPYFILDFPKERGWMWVKE